MDNCIFSNYFLLARSGRNRPVLSCPKSAGRLDARFTKSGGGGSVEVMTTSGSQCSNAASGATFQYVADSKLSGFASGKYENMPTGADGDSSGCLVVADCTVAGCGIIISSAKFFSSQVIPGVDDSVIALAVTGGLVLVFGILIYRCFGLLRSIFCCKRDEDNETGPVVYVVANNPLQSKDAVQV